MTKHSDESALPILNFVWIGEPKINNGGQDVRCLEAIYNKILSQKTTSNPMIFWCQAAHLKHYQAYFENKNIRVEVKAIEAHLETLNQLTPGDRDVIFVINSYRTLTSADRNRTVDFVNFKDLFFTFLLSTKGNQYVLDGTIRPQNKGKPVSFPSYSEHFIPCLLTQDDVWMMYAPYDNQYARKQFKCYQQSYQLWDTWLTKHPQYYYSDMHHTAVQLIAMSAVAHQLLEIKNYCFRPEFSVIESDYSQSCSRWYCLSGRDIPGGAGSNQYIEDLNIVKEYCGSHHIKQKFPAYPFQHIQRCELEELGKDINLYGISVELRVINQETIFSEVSIKNQGLLDAAVDWYIIYQNYPQAVKNYHTDIESRAAHYSNEYLKMIKFLLQKGANPNVPFQIAITHKSRFSCFFNYVEKLDCNTFVSAIIQKDSQLLSLLLNHSQHPIDLNFKFKNKTVLELAEDTQDEPIIALIKNWISDKPQIKWVK